jgi:hypothetical protein
VKTEVVLDACKTGSAVDQLVDADQRDAIDKGKAALEEDLQLAPGLDTGTATETDLPMA